MRTFSTAIVLAALLALPAGAVAKKPDHAAKRAAIAQCKSERGTTKATRKAFHAKYHGFSRCVRQQTAEERAERRAALRNAAKECKAERADPNFPATHDGKTFNEVYRNFGKCVSTKAHAKKEAADTQDQQQASAFKNAAKECQAESADPNFAATHDGKTFEQFYGTNKNARNAFGKCVSGKSQNYSDPIA
jgi:uncharacterized protein YktA (UPF0223 family)